MYRELGDVNFPNILACVPGDRASFRWNFTGLRQFPGSSATVEYARRAFHESRQEFRRHENEPHRRIVAAYLCSGHLLRHDVLHLIISVPRHRVANRPRYLFLSHAHGPLLFFLLAIFSRSCPRHVFLIFNCAFHLVPPRTTHAHATQFLPFRTFEACTLCN